MKASIAIIPFLGSVDAANNLRDNLISYYDIVSTERWDMRFFGFFLGICEANAYSSFRVFANDGKMAHSSFKDTLAWTFLKYCEELALQTEAISYDQRILRSDPNHAHVPMAGMNGKKRARLACRSCSSSGLSGTRIEKSCSCSPLVPMCQTCYNKHLQDI